jgi:DNA-binding NarL/FixJ family response regulator
LIKVIIVDDDSFICASLKTIIEAGADIEVPAVGASGEEAIGLFERYNPDVMLMDIRMGALSGLEAGEIIMKSHPGAKLLFLTTFADDEYIVKALRMGAKGYLIKQNAEAVVPAIRAVMAGQSIFGNEIVSKIPSFIDGHGSPDFSVYGIGAREMEIIEHVAKGLNNKEIANKLYLSEGTVRNYLSAILDKMELRDRTQLAVMYYRRGRR